MQCALEDNACRLSDQSGEDGCPCRYKLFGCRPTSVGWYGAMLRLWAGAFYCWGSLANVLNQSRNINMQGSVEVRLLISCYKAWKLPVVAENQEWNK